MLLGCLAITTGSCCWMSDNVWTRSNNIGPVPDLSNVIRAKGWIHHPSEVLPFFKIWGTKYVVVRLTLHHTGVSGAAGRHSRIMSFLIWCMQQHVSNTVEEECVLGSCACT